jgi:hypothetical protein
MHLDQSRRPERQQHSVVKSSLHKTQAGECVFVLVDMQLSYKQKQHNHNQRRQKAREINEAAQNTAAHNRFCISGHACSDRHLNNAA